MSEPAAVVTLYTSHADSEVTVRALKVAGFDMAKVSVVAKDREAGGLATRFRDVTDGVAVPRPPEPFWIGLWGLLRWSAFLWIPRIGSLLVGGPLLAGIIGSSDGGDVFGGLSAVGIGLSRIGLPKDRIIFYETAIRDNNDLVIAQGTQAEVDVAKAIIEASDVARRSLHRG